MDKAEYFEMLIEVGRQPYWCAFDGQDYNDKDNDSRRKPDAEHPANAWSSYSKLGRFEGWHLPVFDVDMPPDKQTPEVSGLAQHMIETTGRYDPLKDRWTAGAVVLSIFPEAEPRWVPSTTEGHFHVYVDHPIQWTDYLDRLEKLASRAFGVVENGYVSAARRKGATYVRMPGVLKPPPTPEELERLREFQEAERRVLEQNKRLYEAFVNLYPQDNKAYWGKKLDTLSDFGNWLTWDPYPFHLSAEEKMKAFKKLDEF